jgi:hypothetical protein
MAGEHARSVAPAGPFAPEGGEISGPLREVVDMAGDRVGAEATRAGLAAPVERGDSPALPVPVLQRLEVFLVCVSATRKEQQIAARFLDRIRPVDPADRLAVGRGPAAFAGIGGNGTTVKRRRIVNPNSSLLPVVTF